jgi:hypothetical protein
MINLKIQIPSGMNEIQVKGLLLSLITSLDDVGQRRRRGTFISHFFQERLDRKERRSLSLIFHQLQSQLKPEVKDKDHLMKSQVLRDESDIPKKIIKIIKTFQNL